MANTDKPNGFLPYTCESSSGQPTVTYYDLAAANSLIGVGCPVYSVGGVIDKAPATAALMGVAAEEKAANSGGTIAVWDNPMQRFVAQTDNGVGTATAIGAAQLNCDFVAGVPANGRSTSELDETSALNTATLPFKLLFIAPDEDNAYGEFNRWVVEINNHQRKGGTGTLGT